MNRVFILMLGAMVFVTPSKGPCPMRGGVIKIHKGRRVDFIGHVNFSVTINGSDSIVMSATDGVVQVVFSVGDERAVMVRNQGCFYTYSELDSVCFKKNQLVKAGEVIGYSSSKEIEFTASDTAGRSIEHPEKLVECRCEIMK